MIFPDKLQQAIVITEELCLPTDHIWEFILLCSQHESVLKLTIYIIYLGVLAMVLVINFCNDIKITQCVLTSHGWSKGSEITYHVVPIMMVSCFHSTCTSCSKVEIYLVVYFNLTSVNHQRKYFIVYINFYFLFHICFWNCWKIMICTNSFKISYLKTNDCIQC